ncbi:MAG: YidC/Oxa1 family membrane protein insertase [Termitinemataceae bacterium]|nr:MAG: YidC/Oxa1 family membrane protein insertase [Termitinemataceae bacterium]
MLDFIYTLIIFPLVQIIELCFVFSFHIFSNECAAIGAVSLFVSICTLPLYFMAEKKQQAERDIQSRLKPVVQHLKATFSGDERFMMLQTYYRQNHYHPIYAMRTSLSLAIQIPFFIAAYSFLSNLELLEGVSFLFIKDLGAPDASFTIPSWGGVTLNILPVLMTLINCVAGAIYTKNLQIRDKIQIYGMAAVFLVLLYNSPSGLVLYWLMNNTFSLIKNALEKNKNSKKIVYYSVCALALLFFAFFMYIGAWKKRVAISFVMVIVILFPLLKNLFSSFVYKIKQKKELVLEETALNKKHAFFASCIILFLLSGLVIPSSLIVSSVTEFSFIETNKSPIPFLISTVSQAAGIFIFWPVSIYFMFSRKTKMALTFFMTLICVAALINTFLFPGNYGFLSDSLEISNTNALSNNMFFANTGTLAAVFILFSYLLFLHKKWFLYSLQSIAVLSLFVFGIYNLFKIQNEFKALSSRLTVNPTVVYPQAEYTFSKNGKNVLVIFLDRGINGFVPYMFSEKPKLYESFSGFTYYPNCTSFSSHTLMGAPGLYGGYEYTPLEMQKRSNESLVDKHNEALLVLPKIFIDNGFQVTVSDPAYSNYEWFPDISVFKPYPDINVNTIVSSGKYSRYWKKVHVYDSGISITGRLKNNIIRFSFFRELSPMFRKIMYDDGMYLVTSTFKTGTGSYFNPGALSRYITLDVLPEITSIEDSNKNTYTNIYNDMLHAPSFLQNPDYEPFEAVTDKGSGQFSNEAHYHVSMAAFLLLAKWFDFLKENNVYDNTKIIIVSDHGWSINIPPSNNMILPGDREVENYMALLMVKDFNTNGVLKTDNTFMTNADTPLIALDGVVDNPVNPFTHKKLQSNKSEGVTITTSKNWSPGDNEKYKFKIEENEWRHVHDNIYDIKNWSYAEVAE